MIKGRDFIFTGLQPWDLPIGSNARDIADEVSKHNRVLYVNTPLAYGEGRQSERKDIVHRNHVAKKRHAPLREIKANLYLLDLPFRVLPVNVLPDGWLFDLANRFNNWRIFRYVKKIAASLGFDSPIHFIDNDIYRSFYSKEYLKPSLSIYYRRDYVMANDYWQRHGVRLEPRLIAKSDIVACNSEYLTESAREFNAATYNIGQGVDLSMFDRALSSGENIPEMQSISHPIIGYLGYVISGRLDADLIFSLAQRNPAVSFVMAGPEDEVFRNHPLHSLTNVHFTGNVPTENVPLYIKSFDICINPQKVNETTVGNYPRKIDEYLAMGKPTVATHTPGMEMFRDHVYLCDTTDDYQRAFDSILSGEHLVETEECIRFAHTHTWEASVSALYQAIENTYDNGHK